MGWWKINGPGGGIAWTPNQDELPELFNGDGPADIMGEALENINKEYQNTWGRDATREELEAVFAFVMGGRFPKKPLD